MMNCGKCGRESRKDSRFCDACGALVGNYAQEQGFEFNSKALLVGIAISILITIIVTVIAREYGLPLIFGGLFLPFFWWKKSHK